MRGRFYTVFAVLLFSWMPAGATVLPVADWPMYQHSADRNAVFVSPAWDVAWKRRLGIKINGGLSIVGDSLYVESFDRKLYSLDALTGAERWELTLSNIAMNAPVVAGGTVFASTGNNHWMMADGQPQYLGIDGGDYVYAADAQTGVLRWRFNTPGEDMPTGLATSIGGRPAFVFSNGDGHIRALDIARGDLIWQGRFLGGAAMSSLTEYGEYVVGSSTANPVLQRQAYLNGKQSSTELLSWTWAVRKSDGQFVWTSPYGKADCSPAVGDGLVFVEGVYVPLTATQVRAGGFNDPKLQYQARVDALDARTGAKVWEYRAKLGPAQPAGSYEFAIAGMYASGTFYDSLNFTKEFAAFDAKTGHIRWKIATEGAVKMSAVESDGRIYVGDTAGYFYVIDASDGTVRQKMKFPEIFATSPPVIVGGTLFVANGDTVYALRLADVDRGEIPAL